MITEFSPIYQQTMMEDVRGYVTEALASLEQRSQNVDDIILDIDRMSIEFHVVQEVDKLLEAWDSASLMQFESAFYSLQRPIVGRDQGSRDQFSKETKSLLECAYQEIHKALCERDDRYRKEVSQLSDGAKMLYAAIAGYLANSVGIKEAVASAMTGAVLLLVMKMGINAFCDYIKTR